MGIVGILFISWTYVSKAAPKSTSESFKRVKLGQAELQVIVADTFLSREQGLSGHPVLPKNEGMLFVFETSGTYPFWMKDMAFPLDFVWIDQNMRVSQITENISPATFPQSFSSQKPIKYVLELTAGGVAENNISVGDPLVFE